jgi:hypothetical protein
MLVEYWKALREKNKRKKMGRSARRDVAKPKGNEAFNISFAISFVFL